MLESYNKVDANDNEHAGLQPTTTYPEIGPLSPLEEAAPPLEEDAHGPQETNNGNKHDTIEHEQNKENTRVPNEHDQNKESAAVTSENMEVAQASNDNSERSHTDATEEEGSTG
eukprot:11364666-Ditylum_brightwellii.AAC.1